MTSPEDLTAILAAAVNPPSQNPFLQGVIQSFDPISGFNTVLVSGAVFTNLPLVNQADAVNMVPGSVVILLQMGNSTAILGRIFTPGASGILSTSSVAFSGSNPAATNFPVPAADAQIISGVIQVPVWANLAAAIVTVTSIAVNNKTPSGADQQVLTPFINGSPGASFQGATGQPGALHAADGHATRNGFAVTPGGTITVSANLHTISGVAWTAASQNLIQMDSLVVFTHS